MRFSFVALGCAGFIAGCAAVPPAEVDPFANLTAEQRPLKSLSVALVLGQNTKNSIKYSQAHNSANSSIAVDTNKIFGNFGDVLERNFKTVSKFDDLTKANESGADAVAMLDVYASYPEALHSVTASFKVTLGFSNSEGKPIDVIRVEAEKSALATFRLDSTPWAINAAAVEASHKLEAALLASQTLAALAGGVRVAAPPAPVAAAPSTASDIDNPAERAAERSNDFAVVVGVEKYSNELPDAQFAERDAMTARKHFLSLGVPERNIKLLIGGRASRSALEAYLEDWLPKNVKSDGRVFFYFSGHGAPDPQSGLAYLVPWDGNPNFLEKTAYPLKKLYADLGALKVKQVIVALDSCFSGAGGRSVLAEGTRPLVNKVDLSIGSENRLLVFAAASASEVTGTIKEQGHGIFTYFFFKGLSGSARDASGAVTARGLYEYLRPKVRDAASRQNREQTPVMQGAGGELARPR